VRQSKLEEVPSLALGTSPVTLKEMVASYATIANDGNYIEPFLVLRVTDRKGKVLESFQPRPPEPGISLASAQILVDAMRGVVDQGTGVAIRGRFGIQADVAGKTGTTQDNTDGWFILMHPQLVAGAWVGFNDNRITMGDSWGQGARSALPMVGDFFAQSLRTRVVDAQRRFDAPKISGAPESVASQVSDWFQALFPSLPQVVAPPRPPAEEQATPIYVPQPQSQQQQQQPGTVFYPQSPQQAPAPYPSQYPPQSPPQSPPQFPPAGNDQRWEPVPGARPAPASGGAGQPQPANPRYATPGVVIGAPPGDRAP
jgi:penicillin-binding protein 1A